MVLIFVSLLVFFWCHGRPFNIFSPLKTAYPSAKESHLMAINGRQTGPRVVSSACMVSFIQPLKPLVQDFITVVSRWQTFTLQHTCRTIIHTNSTRVSQHYHRNTTKKYLINTILDISERYPNDIRPQHFLIYFQLRNLNT